MALELLWQIFSLFGEIQYWIGLTVGVLIIYQLLPHRDKKRIAWVIFALLPAIIFSYQITYLFKIWFQVPRPCLELSQCPTDYSLPSGHAAVIFAFASVFSLETKKKKFYLAVFILAVLVALSRVFLGFHTYADIAAGALVGVFSGYLIHAAYKTIPILLVEEKVKKKRIKR